ncbi:hypothetical protein FA15DRAFT_241935 [Coprinopsis marcescibilis]|uniref:Actin-like ATPase domain-containing protein n=1 Tax=Coprinopsis marcescibilis TaxID=230819 RepID=A0A5C3KFA6_COPMA|nr:hypothetical protein FA15DRAFT_241935 [Coprinopsis marcescibilis]
MRRTNSPLILKPQNLFQFSHCMMVHRSRPPYSGRNRKLVLAFDVGTTYSGISYSILDPGQVPEIKGVTKFPAQEHNSGASKIPTVMYYDQRGIVRAAGAETLRDGIEEMAEDEGWDKAEWFKLHIRPKSGAADHVAASVPPLPPNKSVIQVLADFLKYLYQCAQGFIEETHISGPALWKQLQPTIEFVISHPNGWEGYQQSQIKEAIILAGLIRDTSAGLARVSFVAEGEASLHFCIDNGIFSKDMGLRNGDCVIIVDAGGGTIDISSYNMMEGIGKAQVFHEVSVPECYFCGSVFVTVFARLFLRNFLAKSDFIDDLAHIVSCFDKTTKLRFTGDKQPQYIKFGSIRDNDPSCQIRYGQLKLDGANVAEFFEPAIQCIIKAVLAQAGVGRHARHVALVGGFSSSDWVHGRVRDALQTHGLSILRPEHRANKAVSDGAIAFYLGRSVTSRISKFAYGIIVSVDYDRSDPEHRRRRAKAYVAVDGQWTLDGLFKVIIPKATRVSETTEFRHETNEIVSSPRELITTQRTIWCYKGDNESPWIDSEATNFVQLCTINANLSHIPLVNGDERNTKRKARGPFTVKLVQVLSFSAAELRAQIAWREKGIEKRTAAKIVYDPNDV